MNGYDRALHLQQQPKNSSSHKAASTTMFSSLMNMQQQRQQQHWSIYLYRHIGIRAGAHFRSHGGSISDHVGEYDQDSRATQQQQQQHTLVSLRLLPFVALHSRPCPLTPAPIGAHFRGYKFTLRVQAQQQRRKQQQQLHQYLQEQQVWSLYLCRDFVARPSSCSVFSRPQRVVPCMTNSTGASVTIDRPRE